jgi:hypothetical protein
MSTFFCLATQKTSPLLLLSLKRVVTKEEMWYEIVFFLRGVKTAVFLVFLLVFSSCPIKKKSFLRSDLSKILPNERIY